MAIVSISVKSAGTTYSTLGVSCHAGQHMYVFGDTTFRLRKAGGGASDWIPVAGTANPAPFYLGTNVGASDYEVGTGTSTADVKIIISDHSL